MKNIEATLPTFPKVPVFWRTARQVRAVAGATFREAIRMKAFAVPVVFAATAVAASPFLPSDGTAEGAVRLAISVSLLTATIFGTFTAVLLASLMPAREARDNTAYLLATKPVPRWGLFAGKVLGISGVLAAMFCGMAALSWIFIRYTAARESARGESARAEVASALAVRSSVKPVWETGPVRTPRTGPKGPIELPPGRAVRWGFSLPLSRSRRRPVEGRIHLGGTDRPAAGGIRARALDPETGRFEKVTVLGADRSGPSRGGPENFLRITVPVEFVHFDPQNPRQPGAVTIEIGNAGSEPLSLAGPHPVILLAGSQASVPEGQTYRWEFRLPPLRAGPTEILTFRLRAHRTGYEAQEVEIEFRGAPAAGVVRYRFKPKPSGTATIELPAGLVGADGRISALLRNLARRSVRLHVGEGLVFSPRAGTLAGALARWAVLEIAKAVFLIILVSAGATVLSFPIPALLGGVVAGGGYLVSFVITLVTSGSDSAWVLVFEGAMRSVLPDLARAAAAGAVADGTLVPAGFILRTVFLLLVVRGGVLAVLGGYLAGRREVGA